MEIYKNVVLLLLLFTASLMSNSLSAASTLCLDSKNKYATPDAMASANCNPPASKWQEVPTEDDKLFCFSIHQGQIQASTEELLKCKIILDKEKSFDDVIQPKKFDALNQLKQLIKPTTPSKT